LHHLHSGNLIGDNTRQEISLLHLSLLKFLSKHTYHLAVAEHIFKKYESQINKNKNLHLIRNAIPYNFRKKDLMQNTLGYIGRFANEKGFKVFLTLSAQLKTKLPKLNIIAIGETNFSNNNINLLPPSFDVEKFYERMDLLLFTSKAPEGLPLVVLEAISFDVGVVAYPITGVVEVLGADYPLYINNPLDAISKIDYFYSDKFDRQKLTDIHKKRSNVFRFDEMIGKINSLYNSLIVTE